MPFVPLESSEAAEISPRALPEAEEESGGRLASSRFVPLEEARPRFVPLEEESGPPSAMPSGRTLALNNPVTAIGETAANLGTQMVALPVAGIAGLATEAGRAMGITEKTGADVVQSVGETLTYQPRGELGKQLTSLVMIPFEKLAEVGKAAGNKVLEVTGNPELATAVDSLIQVSPMLIGPGLKGAKAVKERVEAPKPETPEARGVAPLAESDAPAMESPGRPTAESGVGMAEAIRQTETADIAPPVSMETSARPTAEPTALMQERVADAALENIGKARNIEEAIAAATAAIDIPAEGVAPKRASAGLAERIPSETGPRLLDGDAIKIGALSDEATVPALADAGAQVPHRSTSGNLGVAGEPSDLQGLGGALREELAVSALPMSEMRPGASGPLSLQRNASGNLIISGTPEDVRLLEPALRETMRSQGIPLAKILDHDDGVSLRVSKGADEAAVSAVVEAVNLKRGMPPAEPAGLDTQAKPVLPSLTAAESARPRLDLGTNAYGTRIIRGDTESIAAVEQALRQAFPGKTATLRKREPDGSLALVVAKTLDPELIRGAVDRINGRADPLPAGELATVRAQGGEPTQPRGFVPLEKAQDMATGTQAGTWNPGANYVPFVDDARAPVSKAASVANLPAPIRRERIIKDFADALGTHVYEGRVKGQKRLGFFKKGAEEVRIKRAADIEVAGHEIAHLIDSRVPEIKRAYLSDKAFREDLLAISYDRKNVREGFAEAVRLYLTQPDVLEARAPKAYAWLEGFAGRHEYGPALRKAQADMMAWFEQDALNRARSKIGTEKPLAEYFDRAFDRLRQSTVDDLHGIYQMERDLTRKISQLGPYESARLSRASASIADGAVRYGYPVKNPDGSFKFAGKGLEEILKPVAENLDDALLYFVGRSARELQAQGREHLFTRGEVDSMLRLRTPERDAAFREYQTWNKGILDFAEAQGVINPESRRMWQRTQYLPFHRVGQAEGVKGKPGDWSGVKALTGGTENIRDVLGNMVGNAAMLIDKAIKNEARLKVAELAEKTEGAGRFMVKIDAETRPVRIDTQQVIDSLLKALGIERSGYAARGEKLPKHVQKIIEGLEADLAKSPGFEFVIGGQPPAGRNVVAVLKGGKPTWYEVGDPILYRSLTAIDRPAQNWLVKWLGWPKRVGQTTITATLDFWTANMARDTLMGGVMSRAGFRPILDSLDGMRMRITKDPLYKEWIANGGGLSSIYLDEARFKAKLEKFYGRQGIDYRTVLDTPGKLMGAIETIGDAFEASTRLGEFKRALARGENPRHAAYLAREVSTDFAMKGDSKALGFMYDTVMFLRPAVVSIDRLARGVAHDPNKGAIAAKTATIAGLSAALYLLNKDDPRYADLPDWDRDAHWHFFIGDQHFRYPKIWEIGALASLAERSTEKIVAENPEGLGKDFARILGQTFHLNLMPQIVAPLYEQATNRNSFTKAPIETSGMENVQPFLRAKPGTSETMKAAGMATRNMPESLQVNPVRAEALVRGYLNTWGLYGLMLTDQAFFGDKLPEKRADELPVVRRFYQNEPAKHTKYESQFYDLLGEAKRVRGTLKELDEMNLRGIADDKERSPLAGEAKPLERAAKNLGAINKEIEAVRRDASLTPAEKRQRLDALTVERNALLKATVEDSRRVQTKRKGE